MLITDSIGVHSEFANLFGPTVHAYPGRGIVDLLTLGTTERSDILNSLATEMPDVLTIALGYNDYGQQRPPGDVESILAAFILDAYDSVPGLRIDVVGLWPTLEWYEVTVEAGHTYPRSVYDAAAGNARALAVDALINQGDDTAVNDITFLSIYQKIEMAEEYYDPNAAWLGGALDWIHPTENDGESWLANELRTCIDSARSLAMASPWYRWSAYFYKLRAKCLRCVGK